MSLCVDFSEINELLDQISKKMLIKAATAYCDNNQNLNGPGNGV